MPPAVLQIQVVTATFMPREPAGDDGLQAVIALVANGSPPVSGQVWEEREPSGLPWTAQTVQHMDGHGSAVTLSRPASEDDPMLEPGQLVDLVGQPITCLRPAWDRPFQR